MRQFTRRFDVSIAGNRLTSTGNNEENVTVEDANWKFLHRIGWNTCDQERDAR